MNSSEAIIHEENNTLTERFTLVEERLHKQRMTSKRPMYHELYRINNQLRRSLEDDFLIVEDIQHRKDDTTRSN